MKKKIVWASIIFLVSIFVILETAIILQGKQQKSKITIGDGQNIIGTISDSRQKNRENKAIVIDGNEVKMKTYTNQGWKYTIKYPSELFLKENVQGDKFPGDTTGCPSCGQGGKSLVISDIKNMGIDDIDPMEESLHIVVNIAKDEGQFDWAFKIPSSGKDIDGGAYFWKKVNGENWLLIDNQNRSLQMRFKKDKWVYFFEGRNFGSRKGEDEMKKNYKIIKAIAETFEFTDTPTTGDNIHENDVQ